MYTLLVMFKPIYYTSIVLGAIPISNSKSEKSKWSFLLIFYSFILSGSIACYSFEMILNLSSLIIKRISVTGVIFLLLNIVAEILCLITIVMSWVCRKKLAKIVTSMFAYDEIFGNPKFISSKKFFCINIFIILMGFIYLFSINIVRIDTYGIESEILTIKKIIKILRYWIMILFPYSVLIQFSSIVNIYGLFFVHINEKLVELFNGWDSPVSLNEKEQQNIVSTSQLREGLNTSSPREPYSETEELSLSLRTNRHIIFAKIENDWTGQSPSHSNLISNSSNRYLNRSSRDEPINSVSCHKLPSGLSNTTFRSGLSRILQLHSSFCDELNVINGAFSVQILIGTAERFITLTISAFCVFIPIYPNVNQIAPHIIPLFLLSITWNLLGLVITVVPCALCSSKANRTAILVHKLLNKTKDPAVREELQLFSLQLLHRKVKFTACGFFPLDFTLLYSIIGAVTTYLVILIQFQLSFANVPDSQTNTTTTSAITPYDQAYFNLTFPNASLERP